ncbi:MAG: hypothetical protein M1825_003058 [Sarcosagium campestre]|nr:MAG: hypothetical protein M1825_003058 [Sarcosagium campestre]
MGSFFSKDKFPVEGKTILITGGSQGMGRGVSRLLAQKGANVVIVARDLEKLKNALTYVASAARDPQTQRFHYISADLMKEEEATRVLEETQTWNGGKPPDIVWCIAGSSYPDLFLNMKPSKLREQMDYNYWSTAYVAHAALGSWLRPTQELQNAGKAREAPRHLIFTSSVAAFYSFAGYSAYAPAKAALRSLSDSLSSELQLYAGAKSRQAGGPSPAANVKIHTVFPGTILSPGYDQENLSKPAITKILEEDDKGQTEDQVAATSVAALERGHYLIVTTFLSELLRGAALGASPRNNWLVDTLVGWIMVLVWPFVQWDQDRKVYNFGLKHGHPENYQREAIPK